jgi:hypothetical protein
MPAYPSTSAILRRPPTMKKLFLISCLLLSAALASNAQNGPRTFDNFDRKEGVTVYVPPPPPEPPKTRRVRRGGKWVVEVIDQTAKGSAASAPAKRYVTPIASTRVIMGTNSTLRGFTTGNALHDKYIVEASQKYRIDPLLIYAQMHQESSFKINARSHKGASGLMQLMPATARRFGVTKIYDPKQNIDAGVRYMRWLLDYFEQDVVLALAGYNAGEGAVLRYGRQVPPFRETREYVRRIGARYNSISNPTTVTAQTASSGEQKESRPLTVLEPMPMTVRLPDGKMMLVNQ